MGYSVIYGDTDSLMINTNKVELFSAYEMGVQIKKSINELFKSKEKRG